jgi:serine protease Do
MTISRCIKLFLCCVLCYLAGMRNGYAQNKDNVVFEDYTHNEVNYLQLLKKVGGISSFTSMSAIKKDVQKTKENTIVPVNLVKAGKHVMDPAEMVSKRKESVLIIWKYIPATGKAEKITTFATGIVLSANGICATNYHVMQNMIDTAYELYPSDSILFVSTSSGKLYPITAILSYNKTADIALFKIDTHSDRLNAFPVGEDLAAGAKVHTITNPQGYSYYYTTGVVARNVCTDTADPFTNRTEITADYAKGSSGGPIFDDYGNLVAMVSTTYSIYYSDRPQTNFQMAVKQTIPLSSILRLIK